MINECCSQRSPTSRADTKCDRSVVFVSVITTQDNSNGIGTHVTLPIPLKRLAVTRGAGDCSVCGITQESLDIVVFVALHTACQHSGSSKIVVVHIGTADDVQEPI